MAQLGKEIPCGKEMIQEFLEERDWKRG